MNQNPFQEYIRDSESSKRKRGYARQIGIGLQAVDGLKISNYLLRTAARNIEGEISLQEAKALLQSYCEEHPSRNLGDRTEETDKVFVGVAELLPGKMFSFTPQEYTSIHRKLFTGIYSHAGRLRDYNVTKQGRVLDGVSALYNSVTELRVTLDYDSSEERNFSYEGLSMDGMACHLTGFLLRL